MNKRIANSPAEGVLKKPDPRGSPRENNLSGSLASQQTGTRSSAETSESEMDDMLSQNSRRSSNSSQRTIVEDQPDLVDLSQDMSKLPKPSKLWTMPRSCIENKGPIRHVLEIEFKTCAGEPFRGTITYTEAKRKIFHEILGYELKNFYGVKPGWKSCPIMTFTFVEPTNVDDLAHMQDFVYRREIKAGDETIVQEIDCHIKGLRQKTETGTIWEPFQENWMRVVKIEGTDYQVTTDQILAWLSLYGDILSPIIEDCFEDPEDEGEDGQDGVNATGTFSVKMRLKKEIPQLLPMLGKRVSIYYPGIRKLCSKCFGDHSGKFCKKPKVKWIDYVTKFIESNPHIPREAYGRWIEIIEREREREGWEKASTERRTLKDQIVNYSSQSELSQTEISSEGVESKEPPQSNQATNPKNTDHTINQTHSNEAELTQPPAPEHIDEPNPEDYDLPGDDEEMEEMIERMTAVGIKYPEASKLIKQRIKDYETAVKKYKAEKKKQDQPKKSITSTKSVRGRPRKE